VSGILLGDWDRAGLTWILDTSSGQAVAASGGLRHDYLYVAPEAPGGLGMPRRCAV
jgi:hypothetical protein